MVGRDIDKLDDVDHLKTVSKQLLKIIVHKQAMMRGLCKRLVEAENIVNEIEYINSTLLLSQGKSWIENKNHKKLMEVFSCKNHNDVISEFLFLISNL